MSTTNPETTVRDFFRLFGEGKTEAVMALYEPNAILVAQPGHIAQGAANLRTAVNGFLSMKPTLQLGALNLLVAGDIALSIANWTLDGTAPDGSPVHMQGTTSDVLRRQTDGTWLFVIDNPWGAAVLG